MAARKTNTTTTPKAVEMKKPEGKKARKNKTWEGFQTLIGTGKINDMRAVLK